MTLHWLSDSVQKTSACSETSSLKCVDQSPSTNSVFYWNVKYVVLFHVDHRYEERAADRLNQAVVIQKVREQMNKLFEYSVRSVTYRTLIFLFWSSNSFWESWNRAPLRFPSFSWLYYKDICTAAPFNFGSIIWKNLLSCSRYVWSVGVLGQIWML